MDVLAVDRGDEGAVQPLEDLVGDGVAALLDGADVARDLPVGRLGGEHARQVGGAFDELVGQGCEIGVKLLFPGE